MEGIEEGTPEFRIAAMMGLMNNVSLSWPERLACAQEAIDGLHGLLEEQVAQAKQDLETALYEERAGRDL